MSLWPESDRWERALQPHKYTEGVFPIDEQPNSHNIYSARVTCMSNPRERRQPRKKLGSSIRKNRFVDILL